MCFWAVDITTLCVFSLLLDEKNQPQRKASLDERSVDRAVAMPGAAFELASPTPQNKTLVATQAAMAAPFKQLAFTPLVGKPTTTKTPMTGLTKAAKPKSRVYVGKVEEQQRSRVKKETIKEESKAEPGLFDAALPEATLRARIRQALLAKEQVRFLLSL